MSAHWKRDAISMGGGEDLEERGRETLESRRFHSGDHRQESSPPEDQLTHTRFSFQSQALVSGHWA